MKSVDQSLNSLKLRDVPRITLETNETIEVNETIETILASLNTTYAAKNVSNDHDFTKMFTPSASPSVSPTSLPSIYPTSVPSFSPSIVPTPQPTFVSVKSCDDVASEVVAENEETAINGATSELSSKMITFKYEIVVPVENTDLTEALGMLEERILEETANSFLNCDGRRRLQDGDGHIVRIDSAPVDEEDLIDVECKKDTGIAEEGDMKCVPILGAMTFYNDCGTSSCTYPEKEILESIEETMNGGTFTDESIVRQVNYVDTNVISIKAKSGIAVGATSFLVLGIALGAFVFRRRRSNRHLEMDDLFDDEADEAETSSKASDSFAYDWSSVKKSMNFSEWLNIEPEEEGINVSPSSDSYFSSWKK